MQDEKKGSLIQSNASPPITPPDLTEVTIILRSSELARRGSERAFAKKTINFIKKEPTKRLILNWLLEALQASLLNDPKDSNEACEASANAMVSSIKLLYRPSSFETSGQFELFCLINLRILRKIPEYVNLPGIELILQRILNTLAEEKGQLSMNLVQVSGLKDEDYLKEINKPLSLPALRQLTLNQPVLTQHWLNSMAEDYLAEIKKVCSAANSALPDDYLPNHLKEKGKSNTRNRKNRKKINGTQESSSTPPILKHTVAKIASMYHEIQGSDITHDNKLNYDNLVEAISRLPEEGQDTDPLAIKLYSAFLVGFRALSAEIQKKLEVYNKENEITDQYLELLNLNSNKKKKKTQQPIVKKNLSKVKKNDSAENGVNAKDYYDKGIELYKKLMQQIYYPTSRKIGEDKEIGGLGAAQKQLKLALKALTDPHLRSKSIIALADIYFLRYVLITSNPHDFVKPPYVKLTSDKCLDKAHKYYLAALDKTEKSAENADCIALLKIQIANLMLDYYIPKSKDDPKEYLKWLIQASKHVETMGANTKKIYEFYIASLKSEYHIILSKQGEEELFINARKLSCINSYTRHILLSEIIENTPAVLENLKMALEVLPRQPVAYNGSNDRLVMLITRVPKEDFFVENCLDDPKCFERYAENDNLQTLASYHDFTRRNLQEKIKKIEKTLGDALAFSKREVHNHKIWQEEQANKEIKATLSRGSDTQKTKAQQRKSTRCTELREMGKLLSNLEKIQNQVFSLSTEFNKKFSSLEDRSPPVYSPYREGIKVKVKEKAKVLSVSKPTNRNGP